ncbi:phosphatase PAP2 family protein [Novosphingobium sp. Gsoil 351]|uniref:phosphatase PAP2 family protein n=1 Tax=Novosphingobium sp. Gsoil 351 TaxID=2675225 RepID=UPI0012B4C68B|nr:phosphatase PAP2 family protein [Novosphingobium sp. Gsoil 351]QGN55965.1 hypothetical protein GKE62_16795 [Novosphingobium sp. Gsoil 351]
MARVYEAEAISGGLILAVSGAAIVLAQARGVYLDYVSFAPHYLVAAALIGLATTYRRLGRAPQISMTLMSCAIFVLFTNGGAVLNYLMIHPGSATIDPLLIRADAKIGFDWGAFAAAVSRLGWAANALGWVYKSSLIQLAAMILILGFSGRQVALHRFVLTGVLCSCFSIMIWSLAPSFGPSLYATLSPAVESRLGRVVDPVYTAQLRALLHDGVRTIDANSLIGLIAFPSMHTVMAAMAVWYARRTAIFWPLAILNLAMIPAILVHGGHHLVDVLGGLALFAMVAWRVARLVPDEPLAPALQVQTASGGRLIRIASILPPVFRPNSVPRS